MKRPKLKLLLLLSLPLAVMALIFFLNREPPPERGLEWSFTPPPAPATARDWGWLSRGARVWSDVWRRWLGDPPVRVSVTMYESWGPNLLSCLPSGTAGFTNHSGAVAFVVRDEQALRNGLRNLRDQLTIGPTSPVALRDGERRQIACTRTVWIGGFDPTWRGMRGLDDGVRVNASDHPYPTTGGWWVDVRPRLRGGEIDLESYFSCTESVTQDGKAAHNYVENLAALRTNASFGASTQITNGGGLFMISSPTNRSHKTVAVLISTTLRHGAR